MHKTAARQRPIERDLAAVASQAGNGRHFNCVSIDAYQAPVYSDPAIVHAIMPFEVCRRRRYATAFKIFRRPDHNAVVVD